MLNCVHGNLERIDSLIGTSVGNKAMAMLLERLDGLLDDEREVVFEVIVKLVQEIMDVEPISQVPRLYDSQATKAITSALAGPTMYSQSPRKLRFADHALLSCPPVQEALDAARPGLAGLRLGHQLARLVHPEPPAPPITGYLGP